MRALRNTAAVIGVAWLLAPMWTQSAPLQDPSGPKPPAMVALSMLERQARERLGANPHSPLADEASALFEGLDSGEAPASGHVPNYLRALALEPSTVKPFAHLFETFVYGGSVQPELKLAMALRIAQVNGSAYTAVHVERLLRGSERGTTLLNQMRADRPADLKPAERLALGYAELLTADIYGVDDDTFRRVRGYYNDADVVELTFTACFFNYFTRLNDGLGLPVESWVFDAAVKPPTATLRKVEGPIPRVALISDAEIKMASAALSSADRTRGLGLGIVNAQRAMLRVPDMAQAWSVFMGSTGETAAVNREIQLQVSFAVSMANGCRYCTMHQVLGLRRLGVDPGKLLAMEKSDDALTPRERVAVTFARKLTRRGSDIGAADYGALKAEFNEQGALDVLMQTSTFNFMNRFTDGLRLPSEDEAIRVYTEVYGKDFTRR